MIGPRLSMGVLMLLVLCTGLCTAWVPTTSPLLRTSFNRAPLSALGRSGVSISRMAVGGPGEESPAEAAYVCPPDCRRVRMEKPLGIVFEEVANDKGAVVVQVSQHPRRQAGSNLAHTSEKLSLNVTVFAGWPGIQCRECWHQGGGEAGRRVGDDAQGRQGGRVHLQGIWGQAV